jgi:serine/threonine-protein kinase RsbW
MGPTTRTFSSDLTQLAAMRTFVRDTCRRAWDADADAAAIAALELALDEAAANIILHAYGSEAGRPIELTVDVAADQVGVSLCHEGRHFDPAAAAPPVFDGSREGGFGLYLMRQSVDDVTFFCDAAGRHGIRLLKRRVRSDSRDTCTRS